MKSRTVTPNWMISPPIEASRVAIPTFLYFCTHRHILILLFTPLHGFLFCSLARSFLLSPVCCLFAVTIMQVQLFLIDAFVGATGISLQSMFFKHASSCVVKADGQAAGKGELNSAYSALGTLSGMCFPLMWAKLYGLLPSRLTALPARSPACCSRSVRINYDRYLSLWHGQTMRNTGIRGRPYMAMPYDYYYMHTLYYYYHIAVVV